MSDNGTELMDAQARDTAAFGVDKNAVVEAGAGTGKTTLLIRRLVALLLGPQNAPAIEDIVALTFTEKAAGEIKLRLARTLSDVCAFLCGGAIDERRQKEIEWLLLNIESRFKRPKAELLARAQAALSNLDKATIGTIHSFAARILRLYPVEAGVDPDFTVDDSESLFDDLFESEWAKWLDVELGEKPPRKDAWLEVLSRAGLESFEALARALCAEGADLDLIDQAQPTLATKLLDMAKNLEEAAASQARMGGRSKIEESLKIILERLRGMAKALSQDNPHWPAASAAKTDTESIATKKWPKAWDQAFAPLYDEAYQLAEASSAEDEALTRKAAKLLRPFAENFRKSFARRGFVSFEGLLRRARDLARDHALVRQELKRRFKTFLIDEFQDTDPVQGELLLFLAEEPLDAARQWQDVKLSPGRLFVVGDPKQSIYRFRGADMAAYQRFTDFILSFPGAASCVLEANFRSPEAILSPVNSIFSKVMTHEQDLQPEYKPLHAAKSQAPSPPASSAPAIEFVTASSGGQEGELDAEESRQAQFIWLARWLAEHCGPGKRWGFKDAAVLLRSSSALLPLLDVFKAQGLPYAVEMEKNFYGAPEIIDFLNLLKALDDPGDKIALAGLLRSPLCALDDADLYRLARNGALGYLRELAPGILPPESHVRVSGLFAVLKNLRAYVGREPLSALMRAILQEIPILELASCAYYGEQSAANVAKFARLAFESSERGGSSLKEFIDFAQKEAQDLSREGESPLADEHLEAVRVMTIHKAKGLEFPVVVVADATAKPNYLRRKERAFLSSWPDAVAGLRLPRAGCGAAMALLELEENARQDKETLRLLYVAMTRAKERLVLLGGAKTGAGSLAAWLHSAGAWPKDVEKLSLGGFKLRVRRAELEKNFLRGKKSRIIQDGGELDVKALAGAWKRRLAAQDEALSQPWTMTPTQALKEPEKRGLNVDEDEAPARKSSGVGALVGQLCHRVLELWDFKTTAAAVAAALEKNLRHAAGVLKRQEPLADWPTIESQARDILAKFLASSQARRLGAAEILGREIPFVYEDAGAVMRGTIDVLVRENGSLVVCDYKSEKVLAKDVAARQDKYAAQGAAYAKAVEKTLGEKPEFRLIFLRGPGA